MDYSLPGSSVHGIFQARILEWVFISFSRGPFQPRDQTHISCISRRILYHREAPQNWSIFLPKAGKDRKRNREREEGGRERRKEKKKGGKKERIYFFAHCFSMILLQHLSISALTCFISFPP